MDRNPILITVILIYSTGVCKSNFPCLTWEIRQNELKLIYRVTDFLTPVSLIDSQDQLYAYCTFTGNVHNCSPVERKRLIKVDFSRKYIEFTTATLDENMNGNWFCKQDEHRSTTTVSLLKGIADSTDILVTSRLLSSTSHHAKHALDCFSCRKPDDDNVEFLMNDRTEDSISYNHNTGKCINHKGECHPEECNCTENMFMRVFKLDFKRTSAIFTCEFLFTDSSNQEKFSKVASVVFDGKAYYNKPIATAIIRAADKNLNRIYTTSVDFIHIPSDSTTEVIGISVNNPVGYRGGLSILYVSITVSSCVLGSVVALLLIYLFFKKKRLNDAGMTQDFAKIEDHSSSQQQQEQHLLSQITSRKSNLSNSSKTYQSDDKSTRLLHLDCEREVPNCDYAMNRTKDYIFSGVTTMRRAISLPSKV